MNPKVQLFNYLPLNEIVVSFFLLKDILLDCVHLHKTKISCLSNLCKRTKFAPKMRLLCITQTSRNLKIQWQIKILKNNTSFLLSNSNMLPKSNISKYFCPPDNKSELIKILQRNFSKEYL